MKLYIVINSRENLPDYKDLVSAMWKKGISFSRSGDAPSFKDCTTVALSWDKWIDDPRWGGKEKSHEFIYFEFPKNLNNFENPLTIEIADDALIVDKRAAQEAALYIAEKANGKISLDETTWMKPEDYRKANKDNLSYTFQEASELSFAQSGN